MKIAIIGGGMAGLGAAYGLSQDKSNVITVFEKASILGGLASTVTISGEKLEVFYHHMFPTYFDFLEVSKKLKIEDKIFFSNAKTGVFYNGIKFPFDTPFDLLKFSPLSFLDRIRTGFVIAYLKIVRKWKKFNNVSADEWSKKYFGQNSHKILWEPLLHSKFGSFSKNVGMSWLWGRIYERPSRFGYFLGSFNVFVQAIQNYLQKEGVQFFLGNGVEKIEKRSDGVFLVKTSTKEEIFDHVIVAAAPIPFINLTSNLFPLDFINKLKNYKYLGAICAILVLNQHLSNYYWLNINDKNLPFLGVIEQSNFISSKFYGGNHPVYLSKYLDSESDFYHLSDEAIWSQYLPALKKINNKFDESWIVEKYIFRAPFAQPVITPDYANIFPSYETPINNLWWVSMSHVYPWDRGVDHAFHIGRELARKVINKKDIFFK